MESLALDPGDYAGTYKLIGGRPSLDLVNTISWPPTERRHDWLAIPANVTAWLEAVGLPTMPITETDLPVIHQIRGAVADMLYPLAHGETPSPSVTERFNRHLTRAQARLYIDPVDLSWAWQPPTAAPDLLHPVVIDAAELITEGDR
ncbi:MAG TPA: ABATE domain-containing protein, partial [Acidimicrobiia bacterium]|nr:ABATE domain-containing protein [Acidimicrobiia bacterium]